MNASLRLYCCDGFWGASLFKPGRQPDEGHNRLSVADRVLVETISRASHSREACLAAALRKAAKLGYPAPDVRE